MKSTLTSDEVIEQYGSDIVYTVRRERRTGMKSPLFDVLGRSSLGFAVTYRMAPELFARLGEVLEPEEAARQMRAPLMRPYSLQLFMIADGYLAGREQRLLDNDGRFLDPVEAAEDAARTDLVISWFARASVALRTDGNLFAGEHVFTEPILDVDEVERCAGGAGYSADQEARIQRAFGMLELYAVTLHGEQRDGIHDHGPYASPDGQQLTFHEVNDLANDYLPWVDEAVALPVWAVGAVREYAPDVLTHFDLFGTMNPEPSSATFRTRALWARDENGLRPLELDELESIAAAATAATTEIFRRVAAWEPEYRIRYGCPQFMNHFVPFIRMAGAIELEEWTTRTADEIADEEIKHLKSGVPRSIWAHFASAERMFTPVSALS